MRQRAEVLEEQRGHEAKDQSNRDRNNTEEEEVSEDLKDRVPLEVILSAQVLYCVEQDDTDDVVEDTLAIDD